MRKYVNGEYMDMTAEEVSAIESERQDQPAPTPTLEERVTAVEESTEALKIIMGV